MVAANAGLTMRTVAPTTAAYSVTKEERKNRSVFVSYDYFSWFFFALRGVLSSSHKSLSLSLSPFAGLFPPHPKKIFLPFCCASSFFSFSYSIGPPPFHAHSCNFSLSSRAAKNQSSMHSTTFETKLFTFTTCSCARFSCLREGINLATPAKRGPIEFFSPLFPNDIELRNQNWRGKKIGPRKFLGA